MKSALFFFGFQYNIKIIVLELKEYIFRLYRMYTWCVCISEIEKEVQVQFNIGACPTSKKQKISNPQLSKKIF